MMQVAVTKRFYQDMVRIGSVNSKKVNKKIQHLPQFPKVPQLNIKKMKKEEDMYRLRVGDVRVIFSVDKKRNLIILTRVDYRGSVYKD